MEVKGHPRSMLWYQSKVYEALYDFLLVIISNFGTILHNFGDTVKGEIQFVHTCTFLSLILAPQARGDPLRISP